MKFLVQQQPAFVYTGGKSFDAAKPAMVFIHGAANDHSVWTLQARYAAHHGYTVLAPDLPGHGATFASARTSIGAYADWIVAMLDTGGLAAAALVGHSMGALIALDVAARYPTRVSKLMLIGASLPMPVSDALLDAAQHHPHEAFDMVNAWSHAPRTKFGASAIPGTATVMAGRTLLGKSRVGVIFNDLAACNAFQLDEAVLKNIVTPTLIVSGSHDLMTPSKAGNALSTRLSNARQVVIEGAGHAMMAESPGKVTDCLRTFFAT